MGLIVNGFLGILLIYFGFKNLKTCVFIYVLSLFIAPVLNIQSLGLGFDIWAFPFIVLFYLIRKKSITIKLNSHSLIPYFIIYSLIIIINSLIFDSEISIASLYATFRFIFTISLIFDVWENEILYYVDKVLGVVLLLNLLCAILQITKIVPVKIFYDLYYKASSTPLMSVLELGYFNRAYGTFSSPVILGGVSALAYGIYISAFINDQNKLKFVVPKMIACVICGIMALSKTAILSIPIITILNYAYFLFFNKNIKRTNLIKNIAFIAIGFIGLLFVVVWMEKNGLFIEWYLKYLKNPFEALTTRYDKDSGILKETLKIVKKYFIFGVGDTLFKDVFVGDSTYIVLLYQSGIVGLIAYFFPYFASFLTSLAKRDLIKIMLTVVFLLISLGLNMHLSCWFIPFAAILLESPHYKNDKQ